MKKHKSGDYPSIRILKYIVFSISAILLVFCFVKTKFSNKNVNLNNKKIESEVLLTSNKSLKKLVISKNSADKPQSEVKKESEEIAAEETAQPAPVIETPPIVFDGMTVDQLAAKLDKSLNSTLSGTGYIFANYTAETGMDPYLAVAIVLHETGCKWGCSDMVNTCYNVGGIKGSPGCYGGSYQAYPTLNDGIVSFLNKLYYSYYANGLTTAEAINPSYAESTAWASQVNSYMNEVRNA